MTKKGMRIKGLRIPKEEKKLVQEEEFRRQAKQKAKGGKTSEGERDLYHL
jgi:hypothetical protein